MATDEGRSPEPAVPTSAIEAASERLEAYLKSRQLSQPGAEVRLEDLNSRDEGLPSLDGDEVVGQQANGTETDRRGTEPDARRIVPAWIKVALAVTVVLAAAEGAYIVWGVHTVDVPAAPRSQSSPATGQSTEAPRPVSPPVERATADAADARARRLSPPVGERATNVAPAVAGTAPSATATTGIIEVRTTPPGAAVVFGGRRRGVTPLTIRDVAPGVHDLEVGGWFASRIQRVTVRAGRTSVIELTVPQRRSQPKP